MNILDFIGGTNIIVLNKRLIREVGIKEALVLGELLNKTTHPKQSEWFECTIKELEKEIGLSKYQQSKAIKKLVELDLIEQDLRGQPPKRHLRFKGGN